MLMQLHFACWQFIYVIYIILVYQVDSNMVPKNSSVIVKRVPVQRLEAVYVL